MDEQPGAQPSTADAGSNIGPRDLREWLALVEKDGGLHRITASVDAPARMRVTTSSCRPRNPSKPKTSFKD